jgi:hypothetical protein
MTEVCTQVPDVGVPEDLGHVYFHQLVNGVVSESLDRPLGAPDDVTKSHIHALGICHR